MTVHYSKEKKLWAMTLYKQGFGSRIISRETGISLTQVKRLLKRYRKFGMLGLERQSYTYYSPSNKELIVREILEKSLSCEQAALNYGVSNTAIYSWVQKVKSQGYASLSEIKPPGRPPKDMAHPKKKAEQSELEKLQEENQRLKVENALLKKVQALVKEKEARLREIGRKPSKS